MRSHPPTRAAHPPATYALLYDSECALCRAAARFLSRHARHSITLAGLDGVPAGLLTTLTDAQIRASSHLVTPAGVEYHGGESVTRALRLCPGGWLAAPLDLPGLALVRDLGYALVAANRARISALLRLD